MSKIRLRFERAGGNDEFAVVSDEQVFARVHLADYSTPAEAENAWFLKVEAEALAARVAMIIQAALEKELFR